MIGINRFLLNMLLRQRPMIGTARQSQNPGSEWLHYFLNRSEKPHTKEKPLKRAAFANRKSNGDSVAVYSKATLQRFNAQGISPPPLCAIARGAFRKPYANAP